MVRHIHDVLPETFNSYIQNTVNLFEYYPRCPMVPENTSIKACTGGTRIWHANNACGLWVQPNSTKMCSNVSISRTIHQKQISRQSIDHRLIKRNKKKVSRSIRGISSMDQWDIQHLNLFHELWCNDSVDKTSAEDPSTDLYPWRY